MEPKLTADRAPQVLVIEQGILELLNRQDRAAILDRVRQGMGCVVLLGPIHVANHPGAIATPKIKELIDAAEKLSEPGHGHVLTALNVGQSPAWDKSTLGIETVYSDMLQGIYRSIGRPTRGNHGNITAAATHGQHALERNCFRSGGAGESPRCPRFADAGQRLAHGRTRRGGAPLGRGRCSGEDRRTGVATDARCNAALARRELHARIANAR